MKTKRRITRSWSALVLILLVILGILGNGYRRGCFSDDICYDERNLKNNRTMKKRIVVFLACAVVFSSCEREDENPCGNQLLPKPDLSVSAFFQKFMSEFNYFYNGPLDMDGAFTKTDVDMVRTLGYLFTPHGGDGNGYAGYTGNIISECANADTGRGGPYCGGTSFRAGAILDSIAPSVSYAAVSVGMWWSADPRGHVYNIVLVHQDDSLVWSVQDFMFNYTVVLRGDSNKLADIRAMKQWAQDRVLAQKVFITQNSTATWFLQDNSCVSMNHPIYVGSAMESIHHSGRDLNPFMVKAPRTIEQYADFFQSSDGQTFLQQAQDILGAHGFSDIDISDPRNLPYFLICIRDVYLTKGYQDFHSLVG